MSASTYSWQQKGWPRFTYNRAHLSDELSAFADAFRKVKKAPHAMTRAQGPGRGIVLRLIWVSRLRV